MDEVDRKILEDTRARWRYDAGGDWDPYADKEDRLAQGYSQLIDYKVRLEMFRMVMLHQDPDLWRALQSAWQTQFNLCMALIKSHLELITMTGGASRASHNGREE